MLSISSKRGKVATVSYTEFWDRLNYYGLQALLILYLTKYFGLSDKEGYAIYGAYTALSYGFSIVGGIFADKLLGSYYATILGGVLIAFANMFLAAPGLNFTYLGLSTMVMGIGLLKPNNPNLLGSLYKEDSLERTKVFSIFYLCINIGSILGPILYGFASARHHYWIGFSFTAIGIITAIFFMKGIKSNFLIKKIPISAWVKTIILSVLFILCSYFLLHTPNILGWVLGSLAVIGLLLFMRFQNKLQQQERLSSVSLIVPIIACIIFFAAFLQIYSSLTLFIDRYINKNIAGFEIPTTWFSSIEPFFIILTVPLLNWLWRVLNKKGIEPSSKNKVIIGLVIASVAFLLFSISTFGNSSIAIFSIIIANLLLAVSELCIIPITMSLTNILSPTNYKGTFMGIFYFSLTLSGYLSSLVAKIAPALPGRESAFTHFFIFVSLILFSSSLFLLLVNTLINKIIITKT